MRNLLVLVIVLTNFVTNAQSKPKQYRSAETGRYVKKDYADKNPSTTYSTKKKK